MGLFRSPFEVKPQASAINQGFAGARKSTNGHLALRDYCYRTVYLLRHPRIFVMGQRVSALPLNAGNKGQDLKMPEATA
jgi:hypothetical protein